MKISAQASKLLDQQGVEVVRARYIKEIAVTGDSPSDMKKEMTFGGDKVTLGDVIEWLSKKDESNTRWLKITGVAAIAAAVIALLGAVIALLAWIHPIT